MSTWSDCNLLRQGVTGGDLSALHHIIRSFSQPQLRRIISIRQDALQYFAREEHEDASPELLRDKQRLINERQRLEQDIARLSYFLQTSDLRRPDVDLLLADLEESYEVNTGAVEFSCNFPESPTYYKVAAVVGNRYFSTFDGRTEYRLNEAVSMDSSFDLTQIHQAFVVYRSPEDALDVATPPNSKLLQTPRVLLSFRSDPRSLLRVLDDGSLCMRSLFTLSAVLILRNLHHGKRSTASVRAATETSVLATASEPVPTSKQAGRRRP